MGETGVAERLPDFARLEAGQTLVAEKGWLLKERVDCGTHVASFWIPGASPASLTPGVYSKPVMVRSDEKRGRIAAQFIYEGGRSSTPSFEVLPGRVVL